MLLSILSSLRFMPRLPAHASTCALLQMMGFPPAERRVDSLLAMGKVDSLNTFHTPVELAKVYELQEKATDSHMVFVSDLHLDDASVVEDLQRMLEVYAAFVPVPAVFVFIGNFTSKAFGHLDDDRETFVRSLDNLAAMIASFPSLVSGSQFIFVPGPLDPGAASVLPRPPVRTRC
jgi:DNA polymerase epsilon subunit 2